MGTRENVRSLATGDSDKFSETNCISGSERASRRREGGTGGTIAAPSSLLEHVSWQTQATVSGFIILLAAAEPALPASIHQPLHKLQSTASLHTIVVCPQSLRLYYRPDIKSLASTANRMQVSGIDMRARAKRVTGARSS